ncbi:MAG TPA: hypothetical protein PLZ43_15055 [bacterium]|nr:hypothetical protein [bacterium]
MKLKKKEKQLLNKVKEKVFETLICITTTILFKLLIRIVRLISGI